MHVYLATDRLILRRFTLADLDNLVDLNSDPEGWRALVHKAFAELGARRVFATTMAVNVGSRRVMEKAGLRFVRAFFQEWPDKIPGDELGDIEYALTRADWEQSEATH